MYCRRCQLTSSLRYRSGYPPFRVCEAAAMSSVNEDRMHRLRARELGVGEQATGRGRQKDGHVGREERSEERGRDGAEQRPTEL